MYSMKFPLLVCCSTPHLSFAVVISCSIGWYTTVYSAPTNDGKEDYRLKREEIVDNDTLHTLIDTTIEELSTTTLPTTKTLEITTTAETTDTTTTTLATTTSSTTTTTTPTTTTTTTTTKPTTSATPTTSTTKEKTTAVIKATTLMEEEKPEVGDHIETTLPPKSLTTPAFPATAEQPFDKLTTEIIQVKVTTGEDPVKVTQRKSNGGTVGGKEDDENGEDYAALREHSKNEMIFITVIVALVLFTLIFLTYLYLNYKKHTHITQTQFGNRSLVTAVPKTSHSSTAARGPRYSSRSSNRRPRSSFTPGRSSSKESYRRPRNPPPKPKKKAREPSIEYYDLVDLQRAQRGGGRRWL